MKESAWQLTQFGGKPFSSRWLIAASCEQLAKRQKVDPKTAYNNRNSDPEFAAQWQEALDLAADSLESEISASGSTELIPLASCMGREKRFPAERH